ncbi:hypothetical protein GEV33_008343 [Tenebrio molitor]|uniref:DNA topoisomerase (ATP-hydrolyzing) n=1 Tax=Tenebrio molitor TaxID=7067 RepID=A0A8J6LCC3_TENMO|nr:hypothetical protein GEV33_008343 [Tenebrio molitor]
MTNQNDAGGGGDNTEIIAPTKTLSKKEQTIEKTYQKKSQLEHILLRPDTYIGSVEKVSELMWVYDSEKDMIVQKQIEYVPGLYKIFDEILVNAADNKQRDKKMDCIKIDINSETNTVSVWNNGQGIPVAMHKDENMYVPTMIFGHLLTSSNYNDDEEKVTGGRNGYGAKLCNIFSTKFTVETASKEYKRQFKQTWGNLEKFKMSKLDDDIIALMSRRAYDVAASTRGVKYKKKYNTDEDMKTLRYGKVMIMTDQDQDGSHIKGLLINFIHYNWPELLRRQFLEEFITPIVKARKRNEELSFYSLPEFEEWKSNTANHHTYEIKYYKGGYRSSALICAVPCKTFANVAGAISLDGLPSTNAQQRARTSIRKHHPPDVGLGTSTSKEAKEYFSNMERHRIRFRYQGQQDDDHIVLAFSKKHIEHRKEWLTNFMVESRRRKEIGLPEKYLYAKDTKYVSYADFVNLELVLFSNADNIRSIPCLVDGVKPGQRKVLFTCFKRNDKREVKVAQLAGSVAEMSAYHHGEVSLCMTIVNLAQNFVGSNNLNVLEPRGQFGTRMAGGKDSASPRYIFTKMSPLTRMIFHPHDDALLKHEYDDNLKIEPVWYIPIIPMVLVNGADGIGTGWMTKIPNYNPREIVQNIRGKLDGKDVTPMMPWYKNFKGTIEDCGDQRYVVNGEIAIVGNNKLEITELPVGTWTQNYKENVLEPLLHVDELLKRGYAPDPVKEWKQRSKAEEEEQVPEEEEEAPASEAGSSKKAPVDPEKEFKNSSDVQKFDYLLGMSMWMLTEEKKNELLRQKDNKLAELETLRRKSHADLWREDLDVFMEKLDQVEEKERNDEAGVKPAKKNQLGKKKINLQETMPSPVAQRVAPVISDDLKKRIHNAAKTKENKGKRTIKKENIANDDEKDEFDLLVQNKKTLKDKIGTPEEIEKKTKLKKAKDGLKQTKLNFKKKSPEGKVNGNPKKRGKKAVSDSEESVTPNSGSDVEFSNIVSPVVKERVLSKRAATKQIKYDMCEDDEDDMSSEREEELFDNDAVKDNCQQEKINLSSESEDEPPPPRNETSSEAMFDNLVGRKTENNVEVAPPPPTQKRKKNDYSGSDSDLFSPETETKKLKTKKKKVDSEEGAKKQKPKKKTKKESDDKDFGLPKKPKEPNGLSRDDGKRADGMTLIPWNKGQPLVWDVTVVDTLADSYVLKTSEVSGFAAEMACKRKHNKYRSIISSNYIFKGLAFETLGPWCKETIDFINVIGDRLIAESGDSKSKKFLFERISLAIQRGNAASIRGTFPDSALLSEIFAL